MCVVFRTKSLTLSPILLKSLNAIKIYAAIIGNAVESVRYPDAAALSLEDRIFLFST